MAMSRRLGCLVAAVAVCFACDRTALAQRDLKNIPPPDPELERKAFQVAEGFEVKLFAADPRIAKPIQMNFDERGRLWIASSSVYPQIKPGQEANDKVLVVEDTDGDGRADKTSVFAEGLLIPTGVVPGDGGVYVANSTELIHFSDTNGDGRADRRRTVLSGFGTEDTHHILHTLRFAQDGMLYMNQSIYIHSHIETPYGVRRMNGSGIWQFRPETMRLEIFSLGLVNPWGHHQDAFGQSFATDGAGGEGINHLFPGWVGITSPGAKRVMHGLNPGSPKYCGLAVLSGRHLPPEWRGNLITNDFRAHRVCRFVLSEDGSGFASRQEADLLRSSHVAFRPVDVKMGPDGAIYIADWYNPIIQHGEVDFRDPRRDHVHGRIWRITAKGRPLVKRPRLADAPIAALLAALKAPEQFTRHHAKLVLKSRGAVEVVPALADWVNRLAPDEPAAEHHRLEVLWTYQALDVPEPQLLNSLLSSKDPRVRAAATRVVYHWHDRLDDPLQLLAAQVADEHPRVRLEAVRAASRIAQPQSCAVALQALDAAMDKNLDFALWTTVRDLEHVWLPALKSGELDFDGNVEHLSYALRAIESGEVVPLLIKELRTAKLTGERRAATVGALAALANAEQLRALYDVALDENEPLDRRVSHLEVLVRAALERKTRPTGDLSGIARLAEANDAPLRLAAFDLAGAWKIEGLRSPLTRAANDPKQAPALRHRAIEALARLGGLESRNVLDDLATKDRSGDVRVAAVEALVAVDLSAAAKAAVGLLTSAEPGGQQGQIMRAFLSAKQGPAQLTAALEGAILPPDAAKLALRAVRSSGAEHPELQAALAAAGGLKSGPRKLSPQEARQLLAEVREQGDAARGEAVYRRQNLGCLKCHAIAGAGGQVGPDLVSIGASAQPDYLVEALFEPSKKIKENYHSLIVQTDDGKVITGVKVRQSDTELILRDAEDREVRVPLDAIEGTKDGGSLMPTGLLDEITRSELVDLVRFLSELGKVGPYAVSKSRYVRRWRALADVGQNHFQMSRKGFGTAASDNPELVWTPEYSNVAGSLPRRDLPGLTSRYTKTPVSYLRFELDVTTAGNIRLLYNSTAGLKAWLDGQPVTLASPQTLKLDAGRHHVTLALDHASRTADLQIELVDVPGSKARVQIVGGK